jgi:hypothetical protein
MTMTQAQKDLKAQQKAADAAEELMKAEQLLHIMEVILRLPDICPIHDWLRVNGILDLDGLLTLSHQDISTLTHRVPDPDDQKLKIVATLHAGDQGTLQSFNWYAYHLVKTVYVNNEEIPWLEITRAQYSYFRRHVYKVYSSLDPSDLPSSKPAHQHADEELKSFQKGVKRNSSDYPILKDEKQWDEWSRTVIAEANAQGVGDVLNPLYTPGPAEKDVFEQKQIFMFAVFNRTVKTSAGMALVREHFEDSDAQSIWRNLVVHAKVSTQATLDSDSLLGYITSARLEHWRGTSHNFVLNWLEQVRRYNSYVKVADKLPDGILYNILRNTVRSESSLANVQNTSELIRATSASFGQNGDSIVSYEQYIGLLKSACTTLDSSHSRPLRPSGPNGPGYNDRKPRRPNAINAQFHEHDDINFDSTTDVATIQAYRNDISYPTADYSHDDSQFFVSDSAPSQTPALYAAHLHKAQWSQLTDDEKVIWDTLSQKAKNIITGRTPDPNRPPPRHTPTPPTGGMSARTHDVTVANLLAHIHQLEVGSDSAILTVNQHNQDASSTIQPTDDADLKTMHPASLQRLFASTPQTPATSNPAPKKLVKFGSNINTIQQRVHEISNVSYSSYNNLRSKTGYGTLVDRGANGGVAGDDVRPIHMTARRVNVTGIADHQITDLKIGTVGAYAETQRGPTILIFNQYAYTGKGKTIHSSGQLEWYKNNVCDKSSVVGGSQRIITNSGLAMPLSIVDGLPYLKMRPYTDAEFETYPHEIMTGDDDWDPSRLDSIITDYAAWFNSIPDNSSAVTENPFDDFGEYKKVEKGNITVAKHHFSNAFLSNTISTNDSLEDTIDFCVMTHLEKTQRSEYQALAQEWKDAVENDHDDSDDKSVDFPFEKEADDPSFEEEKTKAHTDVPIVETVEEDEHVPPIPPDPGELPDIKSGPSQTTKKVPDYAALRQFFLWLPETVIEATLGVTTQYARYPAGTRMKKMFKSPFPACNVPRRSEDVATDTFYSDTPAIFGGETVAQLFVGRDSNVSDVYGLKSGKHFVNSLQDNIRHRGAMDRLLSDRAQVEVSERVQDILRAYAIGDWQSEPYHQHQNFAENRYETVKEATNRVMDRHGAPPEAWLLCVEYVVYVLNRTAHKTIGGITPLQFLTGRVPDISALLRFHFWQLVYYKVDEEECKDWPSASTERLAWFAGISDSVGNAMTMKLINCETRAEIFRSRVRSADESAERNLRVDQNDFSSGESESTPPSLLRSKTEKEAEALKNATADALNELNLVGRSYLQEEGDDGQRYRCEIVRAIKARETAHGETKEHQKFVVSVNDDEYEEIVSYNEILDFIERDTNAETTIWRFKSISAHQGPLTSSSPHYNGSRYNVLVNWESGESTYEPLSIIAADSPVVCAEYARKHGLLEEEGWRRFKRIAKRQKKLIRMVNQAKLQSFRTSKVYMYGFQVPRNHMEAMAIDAKNKNTKWRDSEILELAQLEEYQCFLDHGLHAAIPRGYKKIRVHMVYAVKHDGRHKARLVAGGHLTDVPVDSVYSGVVSLRGLRIVLFLAELNGLETWATDIGNAYLEAFTAELVCITAGPEFGDLQGHMLIISRALYGLRSSGKRWHEMFADTMRDLGFVPSKSEGDIWMRMAKEGDIYEYVAVYVDDLAIAVRNPKEFCDLLMEKYKYKLKGTGPISFHLGMDFFRDEDGVLCFAPRRYIDKMVDGYTRMFGEKPKQTYTSPLEKGDNPELDTSELLDMDGIKQYQSLIGALQWAVSIGRIDVTTAVMTMSGFRVAPRQGHIERTKRLYGYLLRFRDAAIRILTDEPDFSDIPEPAHDWMYSVYGEVEVLTPKDAPKPLGKRVTTVTYVDANLYHDMVTGRSVTGILHLLNKFPVDWFSRKQATVETATYGSEFVAARTATDQIMDLRLTLQYLGVPLYKRSYMFGDNEAVVDSSSFPHSKLHKRHQALSFHRVREAVASGMLRFIHIDGPSNPADILSKHWGYQQVKNLLKYLLLNVRRKPVPRTEGE